MKIKLVNKLSSKLFTNQCLCEYHEQLFDALLCYYLKLVSIGKLQLKQINLKKQFSR